jgi:hypothetical protein
MTELAVDFPIEAETGAACKDMIDIKVGTTLVGNREPTGGDMADCLFAEVNRFRAAYSRPLQRPVMTGRNGRNP